MRFSGVVLLVGLLAGGLWPGWGLAEEAAPAELAAEILSGDGPAMVGRAVTLRVRIPGRDPAVIDLPELPDWTVVPRGRVVDAPSPHDPDSPDSPGGPDAPAVSNYRFELIPRHAGELTVPALTVETGGRRLRTAPLVVRVRPRPAPPAGLAGHDLFLDAMVSSHAPYVGQTVVYTLRLYRAVAAATVSLVPPEFPGFAVHALPGQRDGELRAFGKAYVTVAVDYLLTPLRPGRVELPAPTARIGGVGGLSGASRETVLTGPGVALETRPLPPAPGDAPFTGLVGRLTLTSRLLPDVADPLGRRAVYELLLSGRGNLDTAAPPPLAAPPGLTVRPLPVAGTIEATAAGYRGQRVFRYALTAQKAGTFQVPSVRLCFFDPEAGTYRTALAPARPFTVAAQPTPVVAPPLRPFVPTAMAGPPSWFWRIGLGVLPVGLFFLVVLWRRGRTRATSGAPTAAGDVAQALRRALDGPAGQDAHAATLAEALARLDALLYAGCPVAPETLDAARRQGLAALRRVGA